LTTGPMATWPQPQYNNWWANLSDEEVNYWLLRLRRPLTTDETRYLQSRFRHHGRPKAFPNAA